MLETLWQFDLDVFRAINLGWRNPFNDVFYLIFSYLGLGQVQILLVWLTPLAVGGKALVAEQKSRLWMLTWLVVLSGLLLSQTGKKLTSRDRPSNLEFAVRQEEWLRNSFPSGHTTTSFALGWYFLLATWGTRRAWMGWLAMLMALLVGISRIYRGVHWPTDVLGGMCAGLIAAVVARWFEMRKLAS